MTLGISFPTGRSTSSLGVVSQEQAPRKSLSSNKLHNSRRTQQSNVQACKVFKPWSDPSSLVDLPLQTWRARSLSPRVPQAACTAGSLSPRTPPKVYLKEQLRECGKSRTLHARPPSTSPQRVILPNFQGVLAGSPRAQPGTSSSVTSCGTEGVPCVEVDAANAFLVQQQPYASPRAMPSATKLANEAVEKLKQDMKNDSKLGVNYTNRTMRSNLDFSSSPRGSRSRASLSPRATASTAVLRKSVSVAALPLRAIDAKSSPRRRPPHSQYTPCSQTQNGSSFAPSLTPRTQSQAQNGSPFAPSLTPRTQSKTRNGSPFAPSLTPRTQSQAQIGSPFAPSLTPGTPRCHPYDSSLLRKGGLRNENFNEYQGQYFYHVESMQRSIESLQSSIAVLGETLISRLFPGDPTTRQSHPFSPLRSQGAIRSEYPMASNASRTTPGFQTAVDKGDSQVVVPCEGAFPSQLSPRLLSESLSTPDLKTGSSTATCVTGSPNAHVPVSADAVNSQTSATASTSQKEVSPHAAEHFEEEAFSKISQHFFAAKEALEKSMKEYFEEMVEKKEVISKRLEGSLPSSATHNMVVTQEQDMPKTDAAESGGTLPNTSSGQRSLPRHNIPTDANSPMPLSDTVHHSSVDCLQLDASAYHHEEAVSSQKEPERSGSQAEKSRLDTAEEESCIPSAAIAGPPQCGDIVILGSGVAVSHRRRPAIVTKVHDEHCTVVILDDEWQRGREECWPGFQELKIASTAWRLGNRVVIDGMRSKKAQGLNGSSATIILHPKQGHPCFITKEDSPDAPLLGLCVQVDSTAGVKTKSLVLEPKFLVQQEQFLAKMVEKLGNTVDSAFNGTQSSQPLH